MKKKPTLLAAMLLCSMMATAQRTPEHNYDFEKMSVNGVDSFINWSDFYKFFDSWEPGTPPCGLSKLDDEFFISRQRPLPRITEGDYQVRGDVPAGRKMLLWTPLDDPTSTWKALPRYCFEGDNFSMWSYINCHGNWTAPWIRVSAGISDAAAKNGVTVGCVMSVPWGIYLGLTRKDQYSMVLRKLTEKNDDGTFKNSLKLARLMKYYGINGLGVNSEFFSNATTMTQIREFFADVHKKAESIGWKFELQWYDLTNDYGNAMADGGLRGANSRIFGKGDSIVTDQLFANYNWDGELLHRSAEYAKKLNRDPYDYYAGFDIQGRAYKNTHWQELIDNETSVGFWGAHSQSLIHQSATDDGTSDIAIQKAYLLKQELTFSGGNRNPGLLPAVRTDCSLANVDLKTFHGLARLLTAKSTIQSVPFVTRFNLGNGLKYYKEGNVTFDSKWYNLNTQDYLPTWRFWITDRNDEVNTSNIGSLVGAELSWDDVYTGGSSLRLYGATDFSRVKLFKTMLETQPSYELSVTYKLKNGTDPHARLFVALSGDVTNYHEIALPSVAKAGEWTTFKATLDKLGLNPGDKVAMIGVAVENTPDDYQMNIGELALRNPSQVFNTVKPEIKDIQVLRGWYNSVDFKMRYASKEETGDEKTYNDEVGTWYYEIYFQQKGEQPKLLTSTESWAAYVIGAPLVVNGERRCRFGVRAVSPDGNNGSEIEWSDYEEVAYDTRNATIGIDHTVIKPGEKFRVGYNDVLMPPAQKWQIVNSVSGEVVASAENSIAITASIADEGVYDVVVTNADGTETTTRGYVKITPHETGAMPRIGGITADKTSAKAGEAIDYAYTARPSDGHVSRALVVSDPDMLTIPAATQEGRAYSVAMWFKADKWSHDKDGTNLITKNTIADSWPFNNWGEFWVQVRPQWTDETTKMVHPANEISYNTLGWADHDNADGEMVSNGYSIVPGVWTHIVVTQDKDKNQKMYVNGKCVAGPVKMENSVSREEYAKNDSRIKADVPANIHIGGGGVYKAAFNGAVDEVQVWNHALTDDEVARAMKGFSDGEVPDGLQGYYTFEEMDANGEFPNHGKLAGNAAYVERITESGGESTATAQYEKQPADNSLPGYPGITGTIEVKTSAQWNPGVEGDASVIKEEGSVATVSYMYGGQKDVTLTLSNVWGSDSMTKAAIVDVDGPASSVNGVGDNGFAVYPNPFVESVNFRFAEGGDYAVSVLTEAGALVQTTSLRATEGQVANVAITGGKGMYVVQVVKDGRMYKAVKVVKK